MLLNIVVAGALALSPGAVLAQDPPTGPDTQVCKDAGVELDKAVKVASTERKESRDADDAVVKAEAAVIDALADRRKAQKDFDADQSAANALALENAREAVKKAEKARDLAKDTAAREKVESDKANSALELAFATRNEACATPSAPIFVDCADARDAGALPLFRGNPGYREALDGNGNGWACEANESVPSSTPPSSTPAPAPAATGSSVIPQGAPETGDGSAVADNKVPYATAALSLSVVLAMTGLTLVRRWIGRA